MQQQTNFEIRVLAISALAMGVLVFAGCSKAKAPVAEAPAAAPTQQNTTPSSDAPAATQNPTPIIEHSAAAPQQVVSRPAIPVKNGEPDLDELNRALIRWVVGNRRPPANFADFAATAGVTIPPAPPGKKYVIAKNMHVQLVPQ